MRPLRIAALLSVLGLWSAASLAQETAPAQSPPPAAPPASQPAAEAPAAAPAQAQTGKVPSVTPAAGAPVTPRAPSKDEEFIPTEELSADEEVTFPVDL
jgi:hypothetical protein